MQKNEANKSSPRLNLKGVGNAKTAQEEESKKPIPESNYDSFDDNCSSSEDDSDFFDSDDGGFPVKSIQVTNLNQIRERDEAENEEEKRQTLLTESEDEKDVLAQMLMKSSSKQFNHIKCNQNVGCPVLFVARPKGQSRVTRM